MDSDLKNSRLLILGKDLTKLGGYLVFTVFLCCLVYTIFVDWFPVICYPEQLLHEYLTDFSWLGEDFTEALQMSKLYFIPLGLGLILYGLGEIKRLVSL